MVPCVKCKGDHPLSCKFVPQETSLVAIRTQKDG